MYQGQMKTSTQIYVTLLDEGTDVWRPVEAVHLCDDIYRITNSNFNSEDERWQFSPGDVVRCQTHVFADGSKGMVAYEIAGEV